MHYFNTIYKVKFIYDGVFIYILSKNINSAHLRINTMNAPKITAADPTPIRMT